MAAVGRVSRLSTTSVAYHLLVEVDKMSNNRHYAFIPKQTTHSKELNTLPVTARWLYVLMIAERGGLKIPFEFPYREIRRITGFAKTTISRGIKDLVEGGFLDCTHGGLECNPNQYELDDDWLEL